MTTPSWMAGSALAIDALDPKTQNLVNHVQTTKCSIVITRDGEAAAVLVEAGEYDLQRRQLALMERVVRAERDLAEGRTHPQEEVEALLDNWLSDRT